MAAPHLATASAPTGNTHKLSNMTDDQLELTERDLWEDDSGMSHTDCLSVRLPADVA